VSITVIYSKNETEHSVSLAKKKFTIIVAGFISMLIGSLFLIQGYYKNQLTTFENEIVYGHELAKDKYLNQIKEQTDDKLMLLSQKVGLLESEIMRLKQLGDRIVEKTKLPKKEFKFTKKEDVKSTKKVTAPFTSLVFALEMLTEDVNISKKEFIQLDIALTNIHRIGEKHISGRPIDGSGTWLSSPFGVRTDPFTGKLRMHKGVDIAGPVGTSVVASAAGVVIYAGDRLGFMKMVEINHGGGFVTRYAHRKAVTVSVGDVVSKGQQVVVMGSTGRSTGSHVHYEILKNGRQIDPDYYIHRS